MEFRFLLLTTLILLASCNNLVTEEGQRAGSYQVIDPTNLKN